MCCHLVHANVSWLFSSVNAVDCDVSIFNNIGGGDANRKIIKFLMMYFSARFLFYFNQ